MALFADVLDHLEWKNRFRCDGMAMSVYSIILTVTTGAATGIFAGKAVESGCACGQHGELLRHFCDLRYSFGVMPYLALNTF